MQLVVTGCWLAFHAAAAAGSAPITLLLLLELDASCPPNRVPPTTRRSRAAAAPRLPLECAGVGAGTGEAADCSTIPDQEQQQQQIAENHRSAKHSCQSLQHHSASCVAPLCSIGDPPYSVTSTCKISEHQGEAALLQVQAPVSVLAAADMSTLLQRAHLQTTAQTQCSFL